MICGLCVTNNNITFFFKGREKIGVNFARFKLNLPGVVSNYQDLSTTVRYVCTYINFLIHIYEF